MAFGCDLKDTLTVLGRRQFGGQVGAPLRCAIQTRNDRRLGQELVHEGGEVLAERGTITPVEGAHAGLSERVLQSGNKTVEGTLIEQSFLELIEGILGIVEASAAVKRKLADLLIADVLGAFGRLRHGVSQ